MDKLEMEREMHYIIYVDMMKHRIRNYLNKNK